MKKLFTLSLTTFLVLALVLSGCSTEGGTSTSTSLSNSPVQSSTYTVGGVGFQMSGVPRGLTFPTDSFDTATITPTTVTNAYWIAQTDVTYQLWSTVYTWATDSARGANKYIFVSGDGIAGSSGSGSNLQPVTTVSWRDAMIWCNALTEYYNGQNQTNYACVYCTDTTYSTPIRSVDNSTFINLKQGSEDNPCVNSNAKGFRLPTNNEWELAARYIGTTAPTVFPLSTQAEHSGGIYWTPGNYASGATDNCNNTAATAAVAVLNASSTAVVESKTANTLGLFDMDGNVCQWCFDWYPNRNGFIRVYRGNAYWYNTASQLLGGVNSNNPYYVIYYLGFRLVRTQ